ncbi:MAG: hypothetical protein EOP32_02415 [Rhodococcus sp. (in: high G+C Gram-positive bacteria)]|nr:MAG: hypothetical protein EOP32_02415 [Rhodococcus sp. (in: high G+C Gram-positive bacteria)]
MLALAVERTAGVHAYLVNAEHTAIARQAIGPRTRLCPEIKAVLDNRPDRARPISREHLSFYLALPNYTKDLLRLGFMDLIGRLAEVVAWWKAWWHGVRSTTLPIG